MAVVHPGEPGSTAAGGLNRFKKIIILACSFKAVRHVKNESELNKFSRREGFKAGVGNDQSAGST